MPSSTCWSSLLERISLHGWCARLGRTRRGRTTRTPRPRRHAHDRRTWAAASSDPATAGWRARARRSAWRRRARVCVQPDRRRAWYGQDHTRATDHVRPGYPRAPGAALHRARRTTPEDAALPAAVFLLRQREGGL